MQENYRANEALQLDMNKSIEESTEAIKEARKRLAKGPDPYSIEILRGLQDKTLYQGTYQGDKDKRRAKNKSARKSRKAGRK